MFYVPKNCTELIKNSYGTVYHTPENSPEHIAISYEPKATRNHTWLYKFPSHEAMQKKIQEFFSNRERIQQEKQARKEKEKSFDASSIYSIGDIIYNSWGWEQTNIDFFQIVKVTKSNVFLRPITQHVTEYNSSMSEYVAPNPDQFYSEEVTQHKVSSGWYVSFKHGAGNRYDGTPKYQSHYA